MDGAFLALMKREEHLETRQVCFKPITDVSGIKGERKAMGKNGQNEHCLTVFM